MNINYKRTLINPAQIFVSSFFIIIFIGALLLKLPNATYNNISFLDAMFTSTSAVCVTGLVVVDTGSFFTPFGQWIILLLIQIGGLGILTFASFFGFFFRGGSTYENQLVMNDLLNNKKISEVYSVIKNVVLITLTIEIFSAIFIYFSTDKHLFNSLNEHLFFSIFHAVSGFCNAGFSTLPNSLFEFTFRYNYLFHIIILLTFILGGLGFQVINNLVKNVRLFFTKLIFKTRYDSLYLKLSLNERISLFTYLILFILGSIVFGIFEWSNSLGEHSTFGKFVGSFFGGATPRTAGFNSVDMSLLSLPVVVFMFFLMWVGASPTSTGGGIKTSTLAIIILSIIGLAKGNARIEIFIREIAEITLKRALAIVSLSAFVIGFGFFLLTITERNIPALNLLFECISAFSTVGLSLGITSSLSTFGKIVIICVMFIGRVSMLTIIIALVKKQKTPKYKYPTEEIIIN